MRPSDCGYISLGRAGLTFLTLTALRSGCHLPPRRIVSNSKVSLQLRPRETLILKCLREERPFLIRTERCGPPIQRRDGAIPTHVFQNSLPAHSLPPFSWSAVLCTAQFSKSLASLAERADGLRTVDLRSERVVLPFKRRDRSAIGVNSVQKNQEGEKWSREKQPRAICTLPLTSSC